jgi:hypothetical protein
LCWLNKQVKPFFAAREIPDSTGKMPPFFRDPSLSGQPVIVGICAQKKIPSLVRGELLLCGAPRPCLGVPDRLYNGRVEVPNLADFDAFRILARFLP